MKAAKKNIVLTFDHTYEQAIMVNADMEKMSLKRMKRKYM